MKYLLSILCLFIFSCDSGGDDSAGDSSILVYAMSNQKFFSSNVCTGDYTIEWLCFNEGYITYESKDDCEQFCSNECFNEDSDSPEGYYCNGPFESNNDCEQSCGNECFIEDEGYLVINDNLIDVYGHPILYRFTLDPDNLCSLDEDCDGYGEKTDYSQCYNNECYNWNHIGGLVAETYSDCFHGDNFEHNMFASMYNSCMVFNTDNINIYNFQALHNGMDCSSIDIILSDYNIICEDTESPAGISSMCFIQ